MNLLNRSLYRLSLLLFCCFITVVSAIAQAQKPTSATTDKTGILAGQVTDKRTGETLLGASVTLVGTYKGTVTDLDGNYALKNIKQGDYSVRVNYIGYTEKIFTGIRIKEGQTTKLNVQLQDIVFSKQSVEIVGERQIVDLESGKSEVRIQAADIKEMNVRNVQDIVSQQAGVSQSPDGLQIRGGRVYETQYRVDGISASDPLAGTGFGVDVAANSVQDVTVITGGADAEYNGTSGIILTKVKEGGDRLQVSGNWQRDNLNFRNGNRGATGWNTDMAEVSLGGPVAGTKKRLKFFVSTNIGYTDTYFKARANQLRSSIIENNELINERLYAPRQDNKFNNTFKLTYQLSPAVKVSLTNQRSVLVNQNTRTLQIIGFDQIMVPGLQYGFSNLLDNATTYTHVSNLTALNANINLSKTWGLDIIAGRLFTNLRADANGRPFRTATVDRIFDANSIATNPAVLFPVDSLTAFTLPGNGLFNTPDGLSPVWHDHWVQEYTFKYRFTYLSPSKRHFVTLGQEHKEQQMQWVDVTAPWVGASIIIPGVDTIKSQRIGINSDVWGTRTNQGSIFFSDEIKYQGIIAAIGGSLEYWRPGDYAERAVADPRTPLLQETRDQFMRTTYNVFGSRYKLRLLPKVRVSFPISDNQVMYFNYGHSMRLPHPRFLYAGMDPVYVNRAQIGDLGNPALNPEVAVSYEVGIKGQFTRDFGYTFTAFYKDYFDFIVNRSIQVRTASGQFETKSFAINQDYARVRGAELMLTYRLNKALRIMANGSFQVATGKSNTAAESRLQVINQGGVDLTKEQFLAWDRPFDLKGTLIYTPDSAYLFGMSLKNYRFFFSSTWKSGLRYTPVRSFGVTDNGRERLEIDNTRPFAEIGSNWFWCDLRVSRDFRFNGDRKRYFSISIEVNNIFNNKNAQLINPATGRAYENGDPLLFSQRDPRYPSPIDNGLPPSNPARYLQPRQIIYGISFNF